jgi:tetratricopeptide (TPR) repeat protein
VPDRIEEFRKFVEQYPDQPFARYALAMEYRGAGRLDEARNAFADLVARKPDYVPAYLQFGMLLVQMGQRDDARDVFRRGIEAARKSGDGHALSELTSSLESVEKTT